MKRTHINIGIVAMVLATIGYSMLSGADKPRRTQQPANPNVDFLGFAKTTMALHETHERRRISEQEFIHRAAQKGAVVLDARSVSKFKLLHIKGAKNLPLPDFTEQDLQKVLPSKETMVLIYCNNNFNDQPVTFPTKTAKAALNVHTFTVLWNYGYKNIYELAPLLDTKTSKLTFEGTQASTTNLQSSSEKLPPAKSLPANFKPANVKPGKQRTGA